MLDEAIGQGGFAVINVGNDAEVAGLVHISLLGPSWSY
jgi:hypothetical protein